jgi:hypothetical protein
MSTIRSVVTVPAFVAVAVVGLVGIATRTANAAPTTGASCTLASDQSIKLRTDKKLRAARDQAQVCAAASCSAKVRKACQKRVADLATAIPTVVFLVKDSKGHGVSAVNVSLDGDSLADHLDGTALSVDPGQHTFTFETAGMPPYDQSFLIIEGQKDRHETITLPAPAPASPPPPPVAPVVGTADGATTHSSPMTPVAFGLGGVGLATLIVGAVTGALADSKWHDSESECGTATQCPNHAQSVNDHNTASSLATVSTVTLIAGGAALAAGVTLFFAAPKATDEKPSQGLSLRVDPLLGPGVEGFRLEGHF